MSTLIRDEAERLEWRKLSEDSRKLARSCFRAARVLREAGEVTMAVSQFRNGLRALLWARDWLRDAQ